MAYGRNDKLSGAVIAGTVVAVLLIVALSLGFGLGSQSSKKPDSCYSSLQHQDQQNFDPSIPWDRSCPVPNEPTCPDGIDPVLFVMSMDGFRADYLSRGLTPTLERLSNCGVSTPYMRASVPTITFPSHYATVTGLYAESTGMVGNNMYDTKLNESFSIGNENSYKLHWWGGEPIWRTATNEGKQVVSMYWSGSEVTGTGIDHCYFYDESVPFDARINEVMGYFTGAPDTYPSLVMLYMHEPDSSGHYHGPYGDELESNLTYVDSIVQLLMSGIQQRGLGSCANVIVLSDHGMDMTSCDWTLSLEPYYGAMLDELYVHYDETVRITSQYVSVDDEIVPQPNGATPEEILGKVKCAHYNDTMDWYADFMRKEDLPKRLHFANNHRIEEVIGDIAAQYVVFRDETYDCDGGAHGWDNIYESMHTIFIGYGPGFKSGFVTPAFESIELYNVFTKLLNLKTPAPNNGTQGSLHDILSTTESVPQPSPALGSYGSCGYPDSSQEVETRRNHTTTCNWVDVRNFTETPISQLDGQLNLTSGEVDTSTRTHLPLGIPELDYPNPDVCQLTQRDYITGYSEPYSMPAWTAFKLGNNPSCSMLDPDCSRTKGQVPDILRPDVRLMIDQQTECSLYTDASSQIKGHFLFPPGLIDDTDHDDPFDAHIATNVVPMYQGFRSGVWQVTLDLLEEYAEKYGDLHVVVGPIFDYNFDGRRDDITEIEAFVGDGPVPVPTHYYVIASVCTEENTDPLQCTDNTKLLALILPHKQVLSNCWDQRYMAYIGKNVARVRDIELLTDLRFFGTTPTQTRYHMEVHLSEALWDRISWMDLSTSEEDECAPVARPAVCPHSGYDPDHPPLLLISLDGFRPDYLNRGESPTLERLHNCGTSAEYMRSLYPTFTFPNHYTITSGMYPEAHGIVDNNMYDMELQQAFWLGSPNSMNDAWWIGEPLWNRVEKNNKTAMAVFWPGTDVEIDGIRPTRYMPYDGSLPYSVRVSTILDWLENGADGHFPDLLILYFSKIDEAGHENGPDGLMVSESLKTVDDSLKQLMDGIYRQGMHQCINIIVTSDHGMTDMSCDWQVILNEYTDMNALVNKTYTYQGPAGRMSNKYFRMGNDYYHIDTNQRVPTQALVDEFMCQTPNMRVFDKVDLPKRHHYANSPRIDDVTFITRESWLVERFSTWCPIVGQHGWDTSLESMQTIFTGFGPGFLDKVIVEPFENIELYNLMTHLIGIDSGPNNGTQGSLHHLLQNPPALEPSPPSDPYEQCLYPSTDEDYNRRADLGTSQCTCVPPTGVIIKDADERLDKTSENKDALETAHVPHGLPHVYGDTVCVLHQDHYVSGYSHELMMSTWAGFTLTAGQGNTDPQPDCLRPDVRMEQNEQVSCADYQAAGQQNITNGFLFPPAWTGSQLEQMDTLILSNAVPMYNRFKTGIWQSLLDKIEEWANLYTEVHVVTGPVFDSDADGRRDTNLTWLINDKIPVPTHYFAVVLKCPADCSSMNYDVISFALPHKQNITNCMTTDEFLIDNTVRLRDIELLTNLEFLTTARTREGVRTRTYVPVQLW